MSRHQLESLELRTLLAATLDNGVLQITGSDNPETILVSQNADEILVDITGQQQEAFDATQVNAITIDALAGDDTITVDVNRPSTILGGQGADNITGSDGGADSVIGQQGSDTAQLRGGDDIFVWNPGDGSDLVDGQDGSDTLIFNGSNGDEVFEISPLPNDRVRFFRNLGNINMDMGTTEHFVVNALGGNDLLTGSEGLAQLIDLVVNGGDGNDELLGTDGNDTFFGGASEDRIDGNRGSDTAFMGDGDDVFVWDPGDGSDIVEGEAGGDELQFNGSNGDEIFDVSANGTRVRFFRNLGNINMDLNGVERIDIEALGGADQITVNDVSGTDLRDVAIELQGVSGSAQPDGLLDSIIINGTGGNDTITITGDAASGVIVNGLTAQVSIARPDATDTLRINGLGGNDTIDASGLAADAGVLTLDGGSGNDVLLGGAGVDLLIGGDGNDAIDGNRGNDTANMDAGNDTFTWDPGDGSDVIEGGAGIDTLLFNGSGGDEIMEASANGSRLRFTRNLGNINMDAGDTERLDVRAFGGLDTVTIGDLRTTPTNRVIVDGGEGNDVLTGGPGRETFIGGLGEDVLRGNSNHDSLNGGTASGDDNESDRVLGGNGNDSALFGNGDRFDMGNGDDELRFIGTSQSDQITVDFRVSNNLPRARFITNLGTKQAIFSNGEIIAVEALGGNDTVVMSQAAGQVWRARFLGGSGHDLLVGGDLNDELFGETGSDTVIGLGGDDIVDGGSARNVVIQ